jgi:hypothetical protein
VTGLSILSSRPTVGRAGNQFFPFDWILDRTSFILVLSPFGYLRMHSRVRDDKYFFPQPFGLTGELIRAPALMPQRFERALERARRTHGLSERKVRNYRVL